MKIKTAKVSLNMVIGILFLADGHCLLVSLVELLHYIEQRKERLEVEALQQVSVLYGSVGSMSLPDKTPSMRVEGRAAARGSGW